jgi:hypothetical protein
MFSSSFLFKNILKTFADLNFIKDHFVLSTFFDDKKSKIATAMPYPCYRYAILIATAMPCLATAMPCLYYRYAMPLLPLCHAFTTAMPCLYYRYAMPLLPLCHTHCYRYAILIATAMPCL